MKLFAFRLKEARRGAGGPIVHANIDLWTSKNSNEKYIGEVYLESLLSDEVGLVKVASRRLFAFSRRDTGWAGREVVWMFAGRFAFNYNGLDPEIWYGHSLGKSYKL